MKIHTQIGSYMYTYYMNRGCGAHVHAHAYRGMLGHDDRYMYGIKAVFVARSDNPNILQFN